MAMFDGMATSASGMTSHRIWMDVISSNLANADSTRSSEGGPFRRQMVVMSAQEQTGGVAVEQVRDDPTPPRQVFDPAHPDADANGIVAYPNVDPSRELVDMITASRAYEANTVAMGISKSMLQRTFEIGR